MNAEGGVANLAGFQAVSRQALVRVDGAQYSVPSHWSASQATAYVGVADVVLEWREERITVAKQPRGARAVQYRHTWTSWPRSRRRCGRWLRS